MATKQGMSKKYGENPIQPIADSIYVGIVRNNIDPQRMGRLQVWIADLGPDDEKAWLTVSYASPFAGATPLGDATLDGQTEATSQRSYGFWATPPHLDNRVLCCFINGDIGTGFYFACIFQQGMNHMVPSMPMGKSHDEALNAKFAPFGPPTAEYNRKNKAVDAAAPVRPAVSELSGALSKQGLHNDYQRGISGSSARRESPSKVMGILSPGGSAIYIDDDDNNEHVRMRTKSGVQVLLHEKSGYVYINSKDGNSWIEISDHSIDLFSNKTISIRSHQDINMHSDANVNIDAGKTLNLRGKSGVTIQTDKDMDIKAKNLHLESTSKASLKAGGTLAMSSGSSVGIKAASSLSLISKSASVRKAAKILDNSGGPSGPSTTSAKVKKIASMPSAGRATIASRTPAHEPFDRSSGSPSGSGGGSGGSGGSGASGGIAGSLFKDSEGVLKSLPLPKDLSSAISFKGFNFSELIHTSISAASERLGIPYESLMGVAHKISGLNSNLQQGINTVSGILSQGQAIVGSVTGAINQGLGAVNGLIGGGSQAYGLFQLSSNTWSNLFGKYGPDGTVEQNAIKNDPRDTYSNAILGGYLMRDGAQALANNGYSHTMTDAYMTYVLGNQGAAQWQRALLTEPNALTVTVLRRIFGDEAGIRLHDLNPDFTGLQMCQAHNRIKAGVAGSIHIFREYNDIRLQD